MTSTSRTTLTARSPEDLLAVVPVVLGFTPTESVVMLTFGADQTFHARVDLPAASSPTDDLVACLREPAVRHGVRRVVFVVYSEHADRAARVGRRLVRGFRAADIEVVDVLRADGRRWFALLRGRRSTPVGGVPYDVSSHAFAAQAVLEGRVVHASRTELAATLARDADTADLVAAAAPPPAGAEWVRRTTRSLVAQRASPDTDTAARLLAAVGTDVDARDAAWVATPRDDARDHVALWTDLHRRAPTPWAPAAAAVLAMHAWLAGHGALAWCAVERAQELDPDHSLARLVADLLSGAVPPTEWDDVWAESREPA